MRHRAPFFYDVLKSLSKAENSPSSSQVILMRRVSQCAPGAVERGDGEDRNGTYRRYSEGQKLSSTILIPDGLALRSASQAYKVLDFVGFCRGLLLVELARRKVRRSLLHP